jgi:CheY-like chemotaxis protein
MNNNTRRDQRTILLVEDSPEDYQMTIRSFQRSGLANPVHHCKDGDDALDYLHGRGAYSRPSRPSVILLDLNLPGTDGREVLTDIKSNPSLKSIPVIILTTSDHDRDVQRCYQLGANSYVKKPVDVRGFVEALERIKGFWFEVCIIPRTGVDSAA